MLNSTRQDPRSEDIVRRTLTDEPDAHSLSLGCPSCPHFVNCGGLHVEANLFDCLSLCCGNPRSCSRVCSNRPQAFVAQIREVVGLDLDNTPRAPTRPSNLRSDIAELIYHGSRRRLPLRLPIAALRLADLVNYRHKRARFLTRNEMCAAFRIDPACKIIVTGVDHDARIEAWWSLGNDRISTIRSLVDIGINIVTAPNFSLLLDNPRTDDMHAIKRIAITFAEFQREGIACALHPNSRTIRDFDRWGRFISTRPEITTLAYEFITGSGRSTRRQFHVDGLINLAKVAGRPLDVIIRGDPSVVPHLRGYYREVIYIDTMAFMKTQKGRIADRSANDGLRWNRIHTELGMDLDRIMATNLKEQTDFLRAKYFSNTF